MSAEIASFRGRNGAFWWLGAPGGGRSGHPWGFVAVDTGKSYMGVIFWGVPGGTLSD